METIERQEKLELYARAYDLLVDALAQFPREMWHFRAAPDDWTIHEIVIHIADSEANSYIRARRLVAEPGLAVMGYDESRWAQVLEYNQQDAVNALELFRWLRQSTYDLVKNLPEATWGNTVDHPEAGVINLYDWLETYSRHVPNHIEQMESVYAAWLESTA
jgi:hypothetical protein